MSYRTGTYVAFHAGGETDPTASDMRYYRMLMAWKKDEKIDFNFINSHDKTAAVRDTSARATLARRLKERLNCSKNMLLIVGPTTKLDRDWIPFEIAYAVDECGIPIIVTYTGYDRVQDPAALSSLWPATLLARAQNKSVHAIHVPFKRAPIFDAIQQFHLNNLPQTAVDYYDTASYRNWGLI